MAAEVEGIKIDFCSFLILLSSVVSYLGFLTEIA
jgi:hypothetical protein